jgi:three-Cys-motif partner protein
MTNSERWGGSWTEAKINTLRDYLQSFQTALKSTGFHRTYIDALAGDGTWRERSKYAGSLPGLDDLEREAADEIREGSGLVAIGVEPPFDRYVFNDLNQEKAKLLRERAAERGRSSDSVVIKSMDANEFVQNICRKVNPRNQRGVILLDPWGMQVDWSTVERIASTRCLDMWYLFPTQSVVRMLPHAGMPSQAWCDRLDANLGSEEWRTEFYHPVVDDGDLFRRPENRLERAASFGSVETFVIRRLKEAFLDAVLDIPLRLGHRHQPMFSFCFASANPSDKAKALSLKLARAVARANRIGG